jgi:RimJ/RimL family protein N-acetyltransferase
VLGNDLRMAERERQGLDLRTLTEDDLPIVAAWLRREHVRAWWKDPADLASVRAKYLPRIRGDEPTEVFIASTASGPFGLIQRYRFAEYGTWAATVSAAGLRVPAAAGIDYLIGTPELIGRGVGTEMIRSFTEQLLREYLDVETIVAAPQYANRASCRALEKAGYSLAWIGRLDSDDPADADDAAIYVRHRAR